MDGIQSQNGSVWILKTPDERQVLTLCQKLELPELVARLLVARGISLEDAESFLKPTLREFLPDPFHLKGMAEAVERVVQEVVSGQLSVVSEERTNNQQPTTNNSTIAIFGDYDVDGATSSALLMRYFHALGMNPIVYIPDRMKEGYGPNTQALLKLRKQGVRLVITVDCGTLAFEPLAAAKEAGLDVIVLDHHKGEPAMPECCALVNPNRFDETSEHTQLAAVGVTFLFLVALNKKLKEVRATNTLPNLLDYLDLVALGTVCDVVPLTGVNRALVSQGLKIMAGRNNIGISALMDAAKLEDAPSAYHAGFVIGPRINAGGRVGESSLGVRVLTTEDTLEAQQLALQLGRYNEERKAIEAMVLEEAMQQAHAQPADAVAIVIASPRWHMGVIGIVASRIKDVFHKPVAVIALDKGIGKASARSVPGIDIGAAVIAAHQAGVLLGGGGHAMAAGFSIAEAQIESLRDFFTRWMKPFADKIGREKILMLDAATTITAITPELVRAMDQLAPFGAGNPTPKILLTHVKVVKADIVGENHVRAILVDAKSGGAGLKAVAFRSSDNPIGHTLLGRMGIVLHVAGQIKLNRWQGNETAEFIIEDVALASQP
jgi:single-stranded-DNA-specific exonuclease